MTLDPTFLFCVAGAAIIHLEIANNSIKSEMRKEIDELKDKFDSLFDIRPTDIAIDTINLKRTNTFLGWYEISQEELCKYSNEYFDLKLCDSLVTSKILKLHIKKECYILFDGKVIISKNGQDLASIHEAIHLVLGDVVYFHGKDNSVGLDMEIYDVPLLASLPQ